MKTPENIRLSPSFSKQKLFFILAILVTLGCGVPTGKGHYILAERLFSNHKYVAAVEEFQKVVDGDSKGALAQQALYRMGIIYSLYLEDYPSAIRVLSLFVSISKSADLNFQAERMIADLYFSKLENYRQAIESYKNLIEKYPASKEVEYYQFRIGKAYYHLLDFSRALQEFKRIAEFNPKSELMPDVLYQIANTYYTQGDSEQALLAFQSVVSRYPGSSQAVFAQFGVGNCLEERGNAKEALEIYTALLGKHPSRSAVEAKINRISAQEKKRLSRKAI